MSHFLDRLKFMSKVKATFSNGHGAVVKEDRQWEDAYRQRWQHDKIVRSTHGVNCTGSCSWKVYVKNAAEGSKHAARRVGRGIGSGLGKTAGRGHKGQKSRSGGYHKVGFEGGQMPMQRRLPKRGFKSHLLKYNAEINLSELDQLGLDEVDMLALKEAGLVGQMIKVVKVIKSGELTRAVKLTGIGATAGAKAAIEAAGGSLA